jgi:CPA1 family monovalent cation:H+ antiporter
MTSFELAAGLIVLAAFFGYLNHVTLKLPLAIGTTVLTLIASIALTLVGFAVPQLGDLADRAVKAIDMQQTFLYAMLGFLLFAGSLHIDLADLASRRYSVALLSTLGVVTSTVIVGVLTYALLLAFGYPVRPAYCLLFGALISPTDPIAVMAILHSAGVPKEMETTIAGESLFNDGGGVVVFLSVLEVATGESGIDPLHIAELFAWETLGGAALGLGFGYVAYRMLRSIDNYQLEVLISVALVAGGYALANGIHMSGPITMVIAGLIIGNFGRAYAMSQTTVDNLNTFWELIDEVLNAVLFVLIGLEVLALNLTGHYLLVGVCVIPVVLFARAVSVAWPLAIISTRFGKFPRGTRRILTWGGLRGGISVALALSIPGEAKGEPVHERDVIIALTYVVVIFSIIGQGLTLGPLARHWLGVTTPPPEPQCPPRPPDSDTQTSVLPIATPS